VIRRSIFAKIFFWFWAALILVAASVIFITVLSGTQSLGQRWLSHSLDLYGAPPSTSTHAAANPRWKNIWTALIVPPEHHAEKRRRQCFAPGRA